MKKFAYLGLVVVLLAFSVVPVFAASSNGHGSGGNSGHGSSAGDQNRNKQQDRGRDQNRVNHPDLGSENQGSNRMRTPFYLQGTIVSTDTLTMTISVVHGNAQVKKFIGDNIILKVTENTKIVELTQGGESEEPESEAPESEAPSTSSTDDETPGNKVAITFSQLAAGDKVAVHGIVVAEGNGVGVVYEATFITVYVNSAQPSTAQVLPAGTVQSHPNKFGFLHGFHLKIGKWVVNLP